MTFKTVVIQPPGTWVDLEPSQAERIHKWCWQAECNGEFVGKSIVRETEDHALIIERDGWVTEEVANRYLTLISEVYPNSDRVLQKFFVI